MVFEKLQDYGSKRDTRKLRDLEFKYQNKLAHLVQSYIHPSLWFIAEGPRESTMGIPPFDHCLRSDEWTTKLHQAPYSRLCACLRW